MSGIEKIQAIINGNLPITNMAQTIPMKFNYVEDGIVRGSARARSEHQNYSGRVHGGFAASVIDTFAAVAILTKLQSDEYHTTIDLNVKMLKPVRIDQDLVCEGRVINISRSIGVADATLKDENGKILAYGNVSCMIFRNNQT
ncbi:MAG: PaaI family thioesterase [Candidatus Kariarchaeaceae archaeon]